MPATTRWSRSSEWSRPESPRRISPEPLRAESERVGAEVRELGVDPLGREEPDLRALLLPGLGEDERRAVREVELERGRLRPLAAGIRPRQAAGGHQVDVQDELAVRRWGRAGASRAGARPRGVRPSSAVSGGSNVFTVAMCIGPARSTGAVGDRLVQQAAQAPRSRAAPALAPIVAVADQRTSSSVEESWSHGTTSTWPPCATGGLVDSAGDPELVTFLRSSAKPFQALPLALEEPDLPDVELAIACASHDGAPEHLAAVGALLARAGLRRGRPRVRPRARSRA